MVHQEVECRHITVLLRVLVCPDGLTLTNAATLQAGDSAEFQGSRELVKEGSHSARAVQDKKKGLFRRPWGSSHKGGNAKLVKPSKSKLGDGAAPLTQKPTG